MAPDAAGMWTYDFDYSWPFAWGHLLVAIAAASVSWVAWRRRWPRGAIALSATVCLWGIAGAVAMHLAVQIAAPHRLVTASFLPGNAGTVLELGAGSGRATIGLLQARPGIRIVAVDRYEGYYGIDDNTPDRLLRNARAGGVDSRVTVRVADMRSLPFEPQQFDAAFSVAAIDHLPWDGIAQSLQETARVLRPGGQLLIVSLESDAWVKVAMPWAIHGQGFWGSSQQQARWRAALEAAGFRVTESGTAPATRYVLAERR